MTRALILIASVLTFLCITAINWETVAWLRFSAAALVGILVILKFHLSDAEKKRRMRYEHKRI